MDRYVRLWSRPYVFWEPGSIRSSYFEFSYIRRRWITRGQREGGRWHWCVPPLALELTNSGDEGGWSVHIGVIVAQAFIKVPLPRRKVTEWEMQDSWGFTAAEALHLNWGGRFKVLWWPWDWTHHSTEWRLTDGSWATEPKGRWGEVQNWKSVLPLEQRSLPYSYRLDCGDVQVVEASIEVERMTWRRRWLPFLRKSRTCIKVEFSEEVGERTGSWKGGAVGCGYEMLPGESADECLRRMERERVFD